MTQEETYPGTQRRDRMVIGWILAVSFAAVAFLFWLIYIRQTPAEYHEAFAMLPAVNAVLNSISTLCLAAGYIAIRKLKIRLHMSLMVSAFATSTLFLVTYIVYHGVHGDTSFTGTGIIRPVYFAILISHIVLSCIMLPMILTTFYFALTKRFVTHKKIARFTLPIWMYVSITGVVIYFLLKAHS
jgi:putative membrane protein